jgi:hypothetical protein
MNKNRLLTLYFHEGTDREEQEIQNHVNQCNDCQDYILLLDQTNQTLHKWSDHQPHPDTWDLIMAKLPKKQMKPAIAKPIISITPILMILFSIAAILGIIFLVHDKMTLLPIWQTLKEWGPIRFFGSFGVTTILFFLFGILVSLSLAPALILDFQSKKYKYHYN